MAAPFGIKLLRLTERKLRISEQEARWEIEGEFKGELQSLKEKGLVNLSRGFLEVTPRQRVMLAESLIRSGEDAQQVSRLLSWREFEEFAEAALDESSLRSVRHVIFKSKVGRREIDILAWNDVWVLVVDCKHWSGALTHSRMKIAAEAQIERGRALVDRPEVMRRLGIPRIDLPLVPTILTLGEPRERLIHGVPIVGLSRLSSFLQEASPFTAGLLTLHVQAMPKQRSLSSYSCPEA